MKISLKCSNHSDLLDCHSVLLGGILGIKCCDGAVVRISDCVDYTDMRAVGELAAEITLTGWINKKWDKNSLGVIIIWPSIMGVLKSSSFERRKVVLVLIHANLNELLNRLEKFISQGPIMRVGTLCWPWLAGTWCYYLDEISATLRLRSLNYRNPLIGVAFFRARSCGIALISWAGIRPLFVSSSDKYVLIYNSIL